MAAKAWLVGWWERLSPPLDELLAVWGAIEGARQVAGGRHRSSPEPE